MREKNISELHENTIVLISELRKLLVGEVITYELLSFAIDCDVQKEGRNYLNTARKKLQKLYGMLFACVWNVGLKKVDDKGKMGIGENSVKKVGRAAKRGVKNFECVDPSSLSNYEQTKLYSRMSCLGAISLFTEKNLLQKMEEKIVDKPRLLNYKPDLSLFE